VHLHVATCPAAPNPASQLKWALRLPRVQQLWDPPLSQGGLRCRHVYRGSGPTGRRQTSTYPTAPDPATLLGGLWAVTCPMVLCGPRASSIKKNLAGLPVQQGSPAPNVRVHVLKVPDIKAIMSMQDMWAGTTVNACKTCRHTATVRL
jgi:hypothetical protein